VESLAGRWKRVIRDYPCGRRRRIIIATHFLRWNSGAVVASRRSLTRGLDVTVPPEALVSSGLWSRECFYLGLPSEKPLPLTPEARVRMRIPVGWELRRVENITREIAERQKEIGPEFVSLAWTKASPEVEKEFCMSRREWRELVVTSAPTYVRPRRRLLRVSRLLNLSVANTKRYLKPGILQGGRWVTDPHEVTRVSRPSGKRVWLPTGFLSPTFPEHCQEDVDWSEGSRWSRSVRFVSAGHQDFN